MKNFKILNAVLLLLMAFFGSLSLQILFDHYKINNLKKITKQNNKLTINKLLIIKIFNMMKMIFIYNQHKNPINKILIKKIII